MKDKLLQHVGKTVSIENSAHVEMDQNRIGFNAAGKLEYHEDDDSFYVRIGEDYIAGAMGVCFKAAHVAELDKRIYGEPRIILK